MKMILILSTLLIGAVLPTFAGQEWQTMKDLRIAEQSAETEYKQYLKSLTKPELLSAARDCAREIEEGSDKVSQEHAFAQMRFLYEYYPQQDGAISGTDSLIGELKRDTNPELFRSFLVELLSGPWLRKLTRQQQMELYDALHQILKTSKPASGFDASLPKALGSILKSIARGDANVPASDSQLSERGHNFTQEMVKLLADNTIPLEVQRNALSGLMTCYRNKLGGTEKIAETIQEMFQHYATYPEGLWPQLARAAIEEVHLHDAGLVVQEMHDKSVDPQNKKTLKYALYLWEKKQPKR
jgi:hypothetical protein